MEFGIKEGVRIEGAQGSIDLGQQSDDVVRPLMKKPNELVQSVAYGHQSAPVIWQ